MEDGTGVHVPRRDGHVVLKGAHFDAAPLCGWFVDHGSGIGHAEWHQATWASNETAHAASAIRRSPAHVVLCPTDNTVARSDFPR